MGRFAVLDPDDGGRWTFWRVEATNASGSRRELRPWPPDVRWAPLRPPYPEGLDFQQRKAWSQDWYDREYFAWKEAVIAAIEADPQGAAAEFVDRAPAADLPEPTKPRRRSSRRPRPMSAKQRQVAVERLMAEALASAGMSERQVAAEMDLPKTTARRRLLAARRSDAVMSVVSRLVLQARVQELTVQLALAAKSAGPEDLPRLREQLAQVRRLADLAAGREVGA